MANARSKSLHRGHIEKRGETSRRIVIGLGKKEDGTYRIHRETITAPTAAEADERARVRLTEILYQHDKGKFIVSGKMNYGDLLDYWLENYVKIHLEESTYEAYERHVRKRIKRVLGSYDLTQ